MSSRYLGFIHIVFILCIGFLIFHIKTIWNADYNITAPALSTTAMPVNAGSQITNRFHHNRTYYETIVKNDLFRPERSEWLPPKKVKKPAPVTPTTPEPEVIVFGIVICDEVQQAWVSVKHNTVNQNKRRSRRTKGRWGSLKTVTEGDTLAGWVVEDIEPETIYLAQGEKTREYNLIEPGKPKKRAVPRTSYKKTKSKKRYSPPNARHRLPRKRTIRQKRAPRRTR